MNKALTSWKVTFSLTKRHLRLFFKSKLTFFFALLVPIITLAIYLLFLRELELTTVDQILLEYGISNDPLNLETYSLIDSWMLSGILAVSCITVSLNSCYIIVTDREKGVVRDFVSSPVPKWAINVSYFLFNVIVTSSIIGVLLVVCLVYLGVAGGFYLSFASFSYIVVILFLSIVSAALLTVLFTGFITNNAVFNSLVAIVSAGIGFLIGAYMPVSMLPGVAQNVCSLIPGTYSAALLRNYFLGDQMTHLLDFMALDPERYGAVADSIVNDLKNNFSMNVSFFGYEVNVGYCYLGLGLSIVLFAILNAGFANYNLEVSLTGRKKGKKKRG